MTLVIAHRGASYHAPENTLTAFRKACEMSVDGIETDIQITKDHQMVIHHNYTVDDTADGTGQISEMTLEQLKTLDFGAQKNPEYAGERIPTVDECVDTVKALLLINLELKAPVDRTVPYVQMVVDCVKKHDILDRVVLSAFDHNLLREAKRICPKIKVGALTLPPMGEGIGLLHLMASVLPQGVPVSDVNTSDLDLSGIAAKVAPMFPKGQSPEAVLGEMIRGMGAMFANQTMPEIVGSLTKQSDVVQYVKGLDFKIDYLHPDYHSCLADANLVAKMAELGIGVTPYTVDDPADMEKLLRMGCYGIITNRPDLLLEARKHIG